MTTPPSCESVLAEATRLEDKQRDFPKAMALLKTHLVAHPECVEAYVHLAAVSGILRNFADAEEYARLGLAIDPASGRARYYLGCALRSQGRLEDALGEEEPYDKLKRALRAEIDEAAWSALYRTVSRPFARPASGKIAVKVINHYGDEVLKVFGV